MKRIAVIGGGIAGLAAAYYLSRRHECHVFEAAERIGGHTHTVEVERNGGRVRLDTGFIVFNHRTYPNLTRLFEELGVASQPSDMSFSVAGEGLEYSSRGLNGFFAQRSNLARPRHYRLLREILRFNRQAPAVLETGAAGLRLAAMLDGGGYSADFRERYLYPMAGAVWSAGREATAEFPATTLVRFFQQHGMLGINTHPQWRVVRGGSSSYLAPLTAPYRGRIRVAAQVAAIRREEAGAVVEFRDRPGEKFDEVVLACPARHALPLLQPATTAEREVLGQFATSANQVCLHTDAGVLPRRAAARASWNAHLPAANGAGVSYHLNRLQSLAGPEEYLVTLNRPAAVRPERVLRRLDYEHPVYTPAAVAAQARWGEISGRGHTHFCGAYWGYGFHEDGLNSARRVAQALEVAC